MTQPDPLANATLAEMETFAAGLLPTNALDYYASGARDELTFKGNLAAWERWWFVPRMLIDVSTVSLATTILGQPIALPIMVAPMASQRMAHPGRRAGHGPGGRRGRDDHDRVDQHDGPDRGDRRGPGRQVLVPALPVHGLRGDRRDDRAGDRRRREGRLPDRRRGQHVDPKRRPRGGIITPEWVKYPMHPPEAETEPALDWAYRRSPPGAHLRSRSC